MNRRHAVTWKERSLRRRLRGLDGRSRIAFLLSVVFIAVAVTATAWVEGRTQETAPSAHQDMLPAADMASQVNPERRALHQRQEYLLRGLPNGIPALARTRAIEQMRAMPQAAPDISGSGSKWTFIGPLPIKKGEGLGPNGYCSTTGINVSGRATAIAFGNKPLIIYAGSANGGVWKSIDGGRSWKPLTDQQVSTAVGALAVVPNSNTARDVVYVGTGEGNSHCDTEFGQGVLKSTDGGATWTRLGTVTFDRLSFTKLAVAPGGSSVLYAATTNGFTNGSAEECFSATTGTTGIYKSTDGGASWTLLSGTGGLAIGAATDVVVDPTNPLAVYAAVSGNGLFKSVDGGITWSRLTNGAPVGYRTALSISADGSTLYAANAASYSAFDAVYLSTDRGASWTRGGGLPSTPGSACLSEGQPGYDLAVAGDPADFSNVVYLGLTGIYKSADGGASWKYIGAGTHVDYHSLVVNSAGLFAGNDGGLFKSTDGGATWHSSLNNGLGIAQFQTVALPPSGTNTVFGGTPDNGNNLYRGNLAWEHSDDGDGGYALIDNPITTTFFDERFNTPRSLTLRRSKSSAKLGSFSDIAPRPDPPQNVQSYAPFAQDPQNGERILFGTSDVWESCARTSPLSCNGASGSPPTWSDISGDLTGGCAGSFCDVTDIKVAPTDSNTMYVCTGSDGAVGPKMWVSSNSASASPTFSDITSGLFSAGLAAGTPLTSIAVSPASAATVLVGASGFTGGGKHVFLSTNSGTSWTDISTGLPDIPVLKVLVDRNDPAHTFYVGTDIGVFRTTDGGATWVNFNTGTLPIVPVYDLEQNSNMIAAGTHGRGVWAMKTAPAPTLSVAARKLFLGNEFFGGHAGASSTKNVTIFNLRTKKQDATITITGVETTGDFSVPAGVCQGPLAPGTSCPVPVTFTSSTLGPRPGALTVFNSGGGNPQVSLSGRGVRGRISYRQKSLNFGKVAHGTTSPAQTVTITNPNGAALDLGAITPSGPGFAISTNTCGASLAAGAPCTVSVTFTPPGIGKQNGALTINDFARGGPHTIKLTGTGT